MMSLSRSTGAFGPLLLDDDGTKLDDELDELLMALLELDELAIRYPTLVPTP